MPPITIWLALTAVLLAACTASDTLTFLTDPGETPFLVLPDADAFVTSGFVLIGQGYHGRVYLDRARQIVYKVTTIAGSVAGQSVKISDLQCSHLAGVLGISPRLLGVSPSRNVVAFQFLRGYRRLASHNNSLITRDYVLMESPSPTQMLVAQRALRSFRILLEHGIVHDDSHPFNIMYHPSTLDVKIIDYGRANHDISWGAASLLWARRDSDCTTIKPCPWGHLKSIFINNVIAPALGGFHHHRYRNNDAVKALIALMDEYHEVTKLHAPYDLGANRTSDGWLRTVDIRLAFWTRVLRAIRLVDYSVNGPSSGIHKFGRDDEFRLRNTDCLSTQPDWQPAETGPLADPSLRNIRSGC